MISLKAYAKVNLSLYITGIRNDGYHLLDTVMQSISLYDTIEISKREDSLINVTCSDNALNGSENICHKAARLFFEQSKLCGGADIFIDKKIPLAAGLGGGSADAAAVLKGLNAEFGSPLNEAFLSVLALKLGADVPFCLKTGTARVKGIGEETEQIQRNLPLYMVLIKDAEKPSTAAMYKELDGKMNGAFSRTSAYNTCLSLEKGDYKGFIRSLHNDFSLLWDNRNIEQSLLINGADGVCLSGSGPTVMGFFETKEKANKAYSALKEKFNCIYVSQAVNE